MLLRRLVVVGLAGLVSLIGNIATAEDAVAPTTPSYTAITGVSFVDPAAQDELSAAPGLRLSLGPADAPRFAGFASDERRDADPMRRYEVSLFAPRGGGLPVDVAFAQRASIGVDENGNITHQGRGSELRLGRGLSHKRHGAVRSFYDPPLWYAFLASDDEAVTWSPGSDRPGGMRQGFALQDRVEIGDMQAGVTYEIGPVQASLAYVQRKISTRTVGTETVSNNENFAGVTLTMRH